MEEVALDMEEWDLNHGSLEMAFKNCHSRCKEIADNFNSIHNLFQTQFQELKAREEEIKIREKQLEEKESYFESLRESKEEELDAIEEVIIEKLIQVDQVKAELDRVSLLVEEIKIREKQLEEKESYFESLRESKEEELDAIEEVITEKLIQVDQVKAELDHVSLLVEEKRQELNGKEMRFLEVEKLVKENERERDLIQNGSDEGTSNLRRIEKVNGEIDEKVAKDHELKQTQFDLQLNTEQSEHAPRANNEAIPLSGNEVTEIISSLARTKELESSLATNSATFLFSNGQPYAFSNERNVTGFLEDYMSGKYSAQNDLSASLLRSVSDPAKIVLYYMQNFLARSLKNGGCEDRIMLLSNISILKGLMIVSPHVGSHLKEESTTLVAQWKEKMRGNTVNSDESLAFLMFISMYGLVSLLNVDEILKFLGSISQNKSALALCHAHGFGVKIADFILILIQKKHMIEAVRFICTFKVTDKLLPVPLLKEYVEDALKCFEVLCRIRIAVNGKIKAVDNLIGFLEAVHQYIKDYKLKSEFLSADIEMEIYQLEKLKVKWGLMAPSIGSNDEHEEHNKTYSRRVSTRIAK